MSNSIYPSLPGLTYSVFKTPEFSTLVQRSVAGLEVRIAQMRNPLWTFKLQYEFLRDGLNPSELKTLLGFFLARQGNYDDFLFSDPDDNGVSNQQLELTQDAAGNWVSPIARVMGYAADTFAEDIVALDPVNNSGIQVWDDGVLKLRNSDYVVQGPGLALPSGSRSGLYVKWTDYTPTGPVTASYEFFFRVRFKEQSTEFEKFMDLLWANQQVELVSARNV